MLLEYPSQFTSQNNSQYSLQAFYNKPYAHSTPTLDPSNWSNSQDISTLPKLEW